MYLQQCMLGAPVSPVEAPEVMEKVQRRNEKWGRSDIQRYPVH